MSIKQMDYVWALGKDTGPSERLVLLAMADIADDDGYCFPSAKHLAEKCCIAKGTVRKNIKKAVTKRTLKVSRRKRQDGSWTSNGYQLLLQGVGQKRGGGGSNSEGGGRSNREGPTPPIEGEVGANSGDASDPSCIRHVSEQSTPLPPIGGQALSLFGNPEELEPKAFAWLIAATLWNKTAKRQDLPMINLLAANTKRKKRFWERWNEPGFRDDYVLMLVKMSNSDFLTGRISSWRANFDFILENHKGTGTPNYQRILEGVHDNKGKERRIALPTREESREMLEKFIADVRSNDTTTGRGGGEGGDRGGDD